MRIPNRPTTREVDPLDRVLYHTDIPKEANACHIFPEAIYKFQVCV